MYLKYHSKRTFLKYDVLVHASGLMYWITTTKSTRNSLVYNHNTCAQLSAVHEMFLYSLLICEFLIYLCFCSTFCIFNGQCTKMERVLVNSIQNKIQWIKVHKTFRVKPVPVQRDYMTAKVENVLPVSHSTQDIKM